jgi:rSAM/selenodomain-associated transferase 2
VTEVLVSIVVPVLNEEELLAGFLERLQAWRSIAELVVVDGGSTDATIERARPLVDQVLCAQPGRATQMNAGAARARGHYLLFVHCDSELSMSGEEFATHIADEPAWGFCRVNLSGSDWRLRIIEWAMNLRSKITSVATGDQCLFVNREVWLGTGGFANIPLMEDIELCKRLRLLASPHIIKQPVTTSSRRWEQRGLLSTVVLMWRLRLAYWLGASPASLHRKYYV